MQTSTSELVTQGSLCGEWRETGQMNHTLEEPIFFYLYAKTK